MSQSAPTQISQPPLVPSLYALLPPSLYLQTTSNLSLLSIHTSPLAHIDRYYHTTNAVTNQQRILRLRTRPPKRRNGEREFELAYVSSTLSGREFHEMNVKAVVEVGVEGLQSLHEVEDFILTLGFTYTHQHSLSGLSFHLPLNHPKLTLTLNISRLKLESRPLEEDPGETDEPYLMHLFPSRPIPGVPTRGEASLSDVMEWMKSVAERIDGIEWGTGR